MNVNTTVQATHAVATLTPVEYAERMVAALDEFDRWNFPNLVGPARRIRAAASGTRIIGQAAHDGLMPWDYARGVTVHLSLMSRHAWQQLARGEAV